MIFVKSVVLYWAGAKRLAQLPALHEKMNSVGERYRSVKEITEVQAQRKQVPKQFYCTAIPGKFFFEKHKFSCGTVAILSLPS